MFAKEDKYELKIEKTNDSKIESLALALRTLQNKSFN